MKTITDNGIYIVQGGEVVEVRGSARPTINQSGGLAVYWL